MTNSWRIVILNPRWSDHDEAHLMAASPAGGSLDDFFGREATLRNIETLAVADPLVLFVGAGVPASVNVPTWWQLLESLLQRTAHRDPLLVTREQKEAYVKALMGTYDPSFLGSLVRQTFPNDRSLCDAIREELYRTRRSLFTGDLSQNFVQAVCQLILTRHHLDRKTLVLTTNYDDLLEKAIAEDPFPAAMADTRGITAQARTRAPTEDDDPTVLPIYHLHGFVPRDEGEDDDRRIVLSARDYGRDWNGSWTSKVLDDYWECQWLFVGMSFTDAHVNYYLQQRRERAAARSTSGRRRPTPTVPVGIFSLQGKDWQGFDEDVLPSLVTAEKARLAEVGMIPLATDYFFQDAQLLREICLVMKEPRKKSLRYAQRRASWYEALMAKRLPVAKPKQVTEFLEALSAHLQVIRGQVEELSSFFNPDEMFKVELWCRDVKARALFQVGSSEFVHHDPLRARRFALTTRGQSAAAVAAFTRSAPETISAPVAQEHGRWRSFYAAPISLPEWYYLPVGALVIASTATIDPPASSLLANQDEIRRQLSDWLRPMQQALDPRQTFQSPSAGHKLGLREQIESKIPGLRKR